MTVQRVVVVLLALAVVVGVAPPATARPHLDAAVDGSDATLASRGLAGTRLAVDWGDGTPRLAKACPSVRCTARHTYEHSGQYTVTATRASRTTRTPLVVLAPLPADWRTQVIDALSSLRPGEPALAACPRLDHAAQQHDEALAASGTVGHTGPDGSTPLERVVAAGYEPDALGENVAAGLLDPASVTAGWNASPSHRATILDATYTHIGVGAANGKSTRVWVTLHATGGECT